MRGLCERRLEPKFYFRFYWEAGPFSYVLQTVHCIFDDNMTTTFAALVQGCHAPPPLKGLGAGRQFERSGWVVSFEIFSFRLTDSDFKIHQRLSR